MLNNATRRELLDRSRASQFPGSIMEVYRAAEQGIDLLAQHEAQAQEQMQIAQTQQQQEQGLREQHAMGNTDASMAFPDVQPNQSFNTVGMQAPIDIQKIDDQGHLVESYKNVPPGIQDLPTGPYEGTIIESPAAYQKGGVKKENREDPPSLKEFFLKPHKQGMLFTDESARNLESRAKHFINKSKYRLKQYYGAYIKKDPIAKSIIETRKIKRRSVTSPKVPVGGPLVAAMLSPLEAGRGSTVIDPETGINKYTGEKDFFTPFQTGGLRNHMMEYLHDTGRDTTYVNTVMDAISQHESKGNPNQVQVSGNKTEGFYEGPGRGQFQFEIGPKKGGNTAINRTANFLKYNTDKNIKDFPKINKIYNASNSIDFTNISKKDQEALFIGDKIFGGVPRRNAFDAVTRNRTTPPSQEETFNYWLNNHKGKINGKSISELTEKEIEAERKKWNSRTKNVFQKGGLSLNSFSPKSKYSFTLKHPVKRSRKTTKFKDIGDTVGNYFNNYTNPMLINTKKLNVNAAMAADPGLGWKGGPTFNPTGQLTLSAKYRPNKRTNITAGVDYASGEKPFYKAGLSYTLKRGGYRKKYL